MTVLRSQKRSTSASVRTMCSGSGTGSVADTPCAQLWVWSLSPCRYSPSYCTVDRSIPKLMNTTLPFSTHARPCTVRLPSCWAIPSRRPCDGHALFRDPSETEPPGPHGPVGGVEFIFLRTLSACHPSMWDPDLNSLFSCFFFFAFSCVPFPAYSLHRLSSLFISFRRLYFSSLIPFSEILSCIVQTFLFLIPCFLHSISTDAQALVRFAAHIQQVDMESNGKRVSIDGTTLPYECGVSQIPWLLSYLPACCVIPFLV